MDEYDQPKIFIINLTHNSPSEEDICTAVGTDPITQKFNEIKPRLRETLEFPSSTSKKNP